MSVFALILCDIAFFKIHNPKSLRFRSSQSVFCGFYLGICRRGQGSGMLWEWVTLHLKITVGLTDNFTQFFLLPVLSIKETEREVPLLFSGRKHICGTVTETEKRNLSGTFKYRCPSLPKHAHTHMLFLQNTSPLEIIQLKYYNNYYDYIRVQDLRQLNIMSSL